MSTLRNNDMHILGFYRPIFRIHRRHLVSLLKMTYLRLMPEVEVIIDFDSAVRKDNKGKTSLEILNLPIVISAPKLKAKPY